MARKADEMLRGAGASEAIRMSWPPLILRPVAHLDGDFRRRLLARRERKSRFVDGIYIADNSALANALGGPNPTVTCQALATRTAENILVNEFAGAAFVATCSPTLSTDHSNTTALGSVGL